MTEETRNLIDSHQLSRYMLGEAETVLAQANDALYRARTCLWAALGMVGAGGIVGIILGLAVVR